jgi:hypothetical protein
LQEVVEVVHLEMEDQVVVQLAEQVVEHKEDLLEEMVLQAKQTQAAEVEADLIPLLLEVVEEVVLLL